MTFTFQPERYDDGSGSDHWVSGRYKITFYEAYETDNLLRKAHYHAYFKPDGWKNWGMGCEAGNPSYATLEQAQKACERHATIGDYAYREPCRRTASPKPEETPCLRPN